MYTPIVTGFEKNSEVGELVYILLRRTLTPGRVLVSIPESTQLERTTSDSHACNCNDPIISLVATLTVRVKYCMFASRYALSGY